MTQDASYRHAASAYRSVAATTSPLTSVVMLYDAALTDLVRAVAALQEQRLDRAFVHLNRTMTILRGLCHSLDFERGGAFAERMRDTYMRLILSGMHAFNKPDAADQLKKLVVAIEGLRDAWVDVRSQLAKERRPNH